MSDNQLTRARQARQDARAYGARTYHGQDCQRGHGGVRYTSNAQCVACAKGQRADQVERMRDERERMGTAKRNRAPRLAMGADILADL